MDNLFVSLFGTLPRGQEARDAYVRKLRSYKRIMAKCKARGIKPSPKFLQKLTGKTYVAPRELPIPPYRDRELQELIEAARAIDHEEGLSHYGHAGERMRADS